MFGERPDWDEYFLQLADLVATRSTCLRRQVGAVLVKNERIISTGYNGAPRGLEHCLDIGCLREEQGIPSGHRYELCRGVHAEQNALINAAYYGISTAEAVIYCTNQPCIICARMIINAGIIRIVHRGNFDDDLAIKFLKEAGIELVLIPRQANHSR
ncbi:deoxycytidylate deaminase [Syntrophomonas wolfei]|uniref:Putative ComE operon protein 2 n=1 Tax=Syntrophomonas wolfei subsp. wolfei (strain DSM 2245B / Goettingen) TaxID=335541 RepID=Q0AUC4_SYNWW|nr:cytidine/deoxycytidylate deaminase family protein [Syntrophomonas wolfei]ABI69680.1 putative ComE operon protein 2 [Syntrophomonas wolfei subsp. wolfei str. Goettingen G311]